MESKRRSDRFHAKRKRRITARNSGGYVFRREEKCTSILPVLCFFTEKLSSETDEGEKFNPKTVFDIMQSILQVVMINLSNSDDPYLIFESLNFKGEKLTQVDLIRNLILLQFKHTSEEKGGEQEKIYRDFWVPLEESLGDKIGDFFFHYIRMKNATVSNVSRIYSDMKQILSKSESVTACLEDIQKHCEYYQTFLFPEKERNPQIRHELEIINRMKSNVVYPFLLKINDFRGNGISESVYLQTLRTLNSFIIRRRSYRVQKTAVDNFGFSFKSVRSISRKSAKAARECFIFSSSFLRRRSGMRGEQKSEKRVADAVEVLRWARDEKGGTFTRSDFCTKWRKWTRSQGDRILETLVDSGDLESATLSSGPQGGTPRTVYRVIHLAPPVHAPAPTRLFTTCGNSHA